MIQLDKSKYVNPEKVTAVIDFGTDADDKTLGCAVHLEGGTIVEVRSGIKDVLEYLDRKSMYLP